MWPDLTLTPLLFPIELHRKASLEGLAQLNSVFTELP